MNKKVYYLIGAIGTIVGSGMAMLFGADSFSMWSIVGGLVGGVGAIIVVYNFSK